MSAVLTHANTILPGRFAYLMGLYAENYHRLTHMFAVQRLAEGQYFSCVGDDMDLCIEVQQRHPYTVDVSLSYVHVDATTGLPVPSAQLRMYLDAHVAEVLHCHPGKHLWQVLGPWPSVPAVSRHRMRMASFLNRWLVYLGEQGHALGTMERSEPVGS